MAHVVILGGGVGGVAMAYEMREQARRDDTITLISDRDHFQFTPSNPWVAVGWRAPDRIRVPLAEPLARKRIEFLPYAAERLDPEHSKIVLANGETVAYDYLVIATGPELAFDEIEGFGPESVGGHTVSICTTDHAAEAKAAFDRFVENPGPVVIGAVQGASCFGPAYEFAFILDTELKRRRIRDRVPITFVTSEPYIGHMGLDGVGNSKGLIEAAFRERDIKWVINAKVERFRTNGLDVVEVDEDGAEKKRRQLESRFTMMLPAFRGIAPLQNIDGLVNPRGFVLTDRHQRNEAFPNIFSVGVCIAIPPVGRTPVPVGVPKTGFMIESMVSATARNIRQLMEGRDPTHEATWNAICLADFGDTGMAFLAMPQIPPRNVNWTGSGKWVHLAKIGFEKYFIHKVRRGLTVPSYEKLALDLIGAHKVRR
ncbi:MAG: NAD(P)/FAD-dependent oxidoreductase [Alphaproteobacteria bacterium]|nr:MAG: NAD(P)/FAD-dependent oxidoreductase [Alphaproteobacteria bacterium]